jgi:acyl-CoA carboxylase subunit beta
VRWVKCPACAAFVYSKRLQRTLKVCPDCNYHFRLGAGERLAQLLDAGSFQDHSIGVESHDVLGFSDSKPYLTRLAEARRKTGRSEGAVCGPATLGGHPLVVAMDFGFIGHQKGHTTSEMIQRNFGMPDPEGYRKALRLMRYGAKFGMPVICLIDTPGAYPGLGAEERGQAVAIAQCIQTMSRLPVPTVAVVTGEGGSGGALALATADRVLMLENSYYSVISPEGCSTILWNDATAAPRAAAALRITAPDLLRLKVIDAVVAEPEAGAPVNPAATAANLKTAIVTCLDYLRGLSPTELLEARYRRFRAFGQSGLQPNFDSPEERPE